MSIHNETCGNCKYFEASLPDEKDHPSHGLGHCGRFPPQMVSSFPLAEALNAREPGGDVPYETIQRFSVTPVVSHMDTCGEFVRTA